VTNRTSNLRRRYDLTPEAFEAQSASQNHLCAICRGTNGFRSDGERKPLHQDHNKVTGALRELLCLKCNLMIGFAGPRGDSQEILLRALFYLRKHNGSETFYVEENPETQAARDAEFERSLLMPADPSGKVPEEEILPVEFAPAVSLSPTEQVGAPRSEFD
jgi:Recombination endonuclease VII